MGDAANPFEAVRTMMLENLEKVQSATQSYIDTVEKAMRGFPGANEDQITTFKAYLERKVAANRDSWKSSCARRTSKKRSALRSNISNPN